MLPVDGHLLRIFIGEDRKHGRTPLYEWIVRKAGLIMLESPAVPAMIRARPNPDGKLNG